MLIMYVLLILENGLVLIDYMSTMLEKRNMSIHQEYNTVVEEKVQPLNQNLVIRLEVIVLV